MKDILLDENFDLLFENGDLVIGNSDQQHQKLLLVTSKGEWREHPTVGVGLYGMLKDEDRGQLYGLIKAEFEKDGMTVSKIGPASGGNLIIEASYE